MSEVLTAPIDFVSSQNTSADQLGGAAPLSQNVILDENGVARARPGISTWSVFDPAKAGGSPVIGMAAWGTNLVYVTEDRNIHCVSASGLHTELSSGTATTKLDGGKRPVFLVGREMVVIAGGGAMQCWTGGATLSRRLTNTGIGGDPPEASFICGIAQRLVAQVEDASGQIWWSGSIEEYENWDMSTGQAGFIQAAAKPDPLVAVFDNTNEVFAFGSGTLQVFAPANIAIDTDAVTGLPITLDFASSRTMNIGLDAPYSVVPVDDMFAMLDNQRRIILTDGRSYTNISAKTVSRQIYGYSKVDDCWSFRMRYGRFDCLVFFFPTIGRGLIYDNVLDRWSEWAMGGVGEGPLTITSAYNWSQENVFLVGLSDGSIAKLDENATTDLGVPISIQLITGFQTHGSPQQKACNAVMVQFRRNMTDATATSGRVRLSSRDYEGAWNWVKDIELNSSKNPEITLRSLRPYRQRQWKLSYTGSDAFAFASAQEQYELLGA